MEIPHANHQKCKWIKIQKDLIWDVSIYIIAKLYKVSGFFTFAAYCSTTNTYSFSHVYSSHTCVVTRLEVRIVNLSFNAARV